MFNWTPFSSIISWLPFVRPHLVSHRCPFSFHSLLVWRGRHQTKVRQSMNCSFPCHFLRLCISFICFEAIKLEYSSCQRKRLIIIKQCLSILFWQLCLIYHLQQHNCKNAFCNSFLSISGLPIKNIYMWCKIRLNSSCKTNRSGVLLEIWIASKIISITNYFFSWAILSIVS